MSREKSPLRLGAEIFSRHSAPMIERALSIREWSSSGLVCRFASACEAENCFLSPVVPYSFVTAPFVSETYKPDSYPLNGWQRMVLSETRGLWLSSIVRGSIGWIRRLACFTGLTWTIDTFPRNRASQESDGHLRERFPGMERTLSQRRSSCLLFQMIGVETYILLPDDQRDRGNLPC